jgi:predicted SAM-dependent methyltransferase
MRNEELTRIGGGLKLNIGCGRNYRRGYVNIDAFDDTVADKLMAAEDMDFEDNMFSEVACIHTLEHLGPARSIYALSEIYRVLQPSGVLLLQTPDLVTSFMSFVKGNWEKRKLIMNWVFGLDSPGMSHRYGFPAELLQLVLREVGFEEIKIEYIDTNSLNPTIQARCTKQINPVYQFISRFRKNLVRERFVSLDQQVEVLEIESLIQEIIHIIGTSGTALNRNHIRRITVTAGTCSPRIGRVFLETMIVSGRVDPNLSEKYVSLLKELEDTGFVKLLTHLFMKMPIMPGRQKDTFQALRSMMEKAIDKQLAGERETGKIYATAASQLAGWIESTYFSETMLKELSEQRLALGLKTFAHEQLEQAESHFVDAIRLNRDSILAYWNIARVFALRGLTERSLKCYRSVVDLIPTQYLKQSRRYLKSVEKEIKSVSQGDLLVAGTPIDSMP